MNNCSFCNSKQIYHLKNGHIKCAACKRKYSLKKQQRDKEIIHTFCMDITALTASKTLHLNYVTVQRRYQEFRSLITEFLDKDHHLKERRSNEFDEYLYMKNDNIYLAQNFLTYHYENSIYNLMLPSLYKYRTFEKNEEDLSKFLFLNRISKLESKNSLINEFWNFLEEFLKKFKGVNSSHFIYYLKEAEFKFNYDKKTQEEILLKLYLS